MTIKKILGLAAVASLFMYLAVMFIKPAPQQAATAAIQGIYFAAPNVLNAFELTDMTGNSYSDQSLQGHYTLLFFGYTYCPDVCPTTLAMLDKATTFFQADHPRLPQPKVVFVSLDPARDTPEQLTKYMAHFNPDFMAVTGSESALRLLTQQVGVAFDKVIPDPEKPEQYLIEHSTGLVLVNPRGGMVAVFTPPFDPQKLSDELAKVYLAQGLRE